MTDQPVTPDREALKAAIRAVSFKAHQPERVYVDDCIGEEGLDALADGLLPYLTDALDRARQQGRDDAAEAIQNVTMSWCTSPTGRHLLSSAARLARGADRKAADAPWDTALAVDHVHRTARPHPRRRL